jgi:CheY-like chemotaxis protein
MKAETTGNASILLVEDDAGHALLIEKNLRRAGLPYPIVKLDDGRKAVDYLFGEGDGQTALMLLDLNLPVLDGYQVLKIVKNDARTKLIPVVMLTTTDNPQEIAKCYELGCNLYMTKPIDYDQFSETIRMLGLFLSVVKVPETR